MRGGLTKLSSTVGSSPLLAQTKGNPKAFGAILLASALLVIGVVTLAAQAPPNTAHIWVDTDGGSCVRNASPVGYVDNQVADTGSCSSFDAAYDISQPGDTILIRGGDYGAQEVNVNVGRGSDRTYLLV